MLLIKCLLFSFQFFAFNCIYQCTYAYAQSFIVVFSSADINRATFTNQELLAEAARVTQLVNNDQFADHANANNVAKKYNKY